MANPIQTSSTQSNTLSVKLLKYITSDDLESADQSKTKNLKNLANRIKLANQKFKPDVAKRQNVNLQLTSNGIDLTKEQIYAAQIKMKLKKESTKKPIQKEPQEAIINLSVDESKSSFQNQLINAQQNAAYRAIYQALTRQTQNYGSRIKANTRLKQVKMKNANRMKNIKEDQRSHYHTESHNERLMQSKPSINQICNKFASLVQDSSVQNIHHQLFSQYLDRDTVNDKLSQRWLAVLYFQIQMAKQVCPKLNKSDLEFNQSKTVNNCLTAASIASLDKIFKDIYKEKMDLFQQGYFTANSRHMKSRWAELYFLLRNNKSEEFIWELKRLDQVLGEVFQNVLDKLNQYERPQDSFNNFPINQHTNHFQKIIKLIVLGKNQYVFKELAVKIRALQQPWFILIALSLSKSTQKQQKQSLKRLKKATSDYYTMLINNAIATPFDLELIVDFMTGLLSLRNYRLFLELYKGLSEKGTSQDHQWYFDFVHAFILVTANPELVYSQTKRVQAEQIITYMLSEIVKYLKYLKKSQPQYFKGYFNLLLHIFSNLSAQGVGLPLQSIIEQLCSSLFVKFQDLKLISPHDLQYLKESDDVLKMLQTNILKHINPQNQQQFIQLAQFCDSIKQKRLQEHILVRLIIFNYFQAEKIKKRLETEGLFEKGEIILNETIFSKKVGTAEEFLQKTMPLDRNEILNFMSNLKRLRSCILQRRKDILRNEYKTIGRYRTQNHRVFQYLQQMDSNQKSELLDIFASYYELLNQMFKLIYLSSSSLNKYENQRCQLLEEFKNIKAKYLSIESPAYNKTLQSLKK